MCSTEHTKFQLFLLTSRQNYAGLSFFFDPVVTGGFPSFCALLHDKNCLSVAVGLGKNKGYYLEQDLGGENGLLGLAERDIQKGNGGLFPLGCHTVGKLDCDLLFFYSDEHSAVYDLFVV